MSSAMIRSTVSNPSCCCTVLAAWTIGISSLASHTARAASQESGNLLLDEVIAGAESNLEKIAFGSARYRLTGKRYNRRDGTWSDVESDIRVLFDGARYREDHGDQRVLFTGDAYVEFHAPYLGTPDEYEPFNYSVIVREPVFEKPLTAHPRMQGLLLPTNIAEEIRAMRTKGDWDFSCERDAGGIIIVASSATLRVEATYRVDPRQGYGVTNYQVRRLAEPPGVTTQVESSYRLNSNGAHVVDGTRRQLWAVIGDKLIDRSDTQIALVDIDLQNRPPPHELRLEGLGLPIGARIQDRIHGREFLFGVDPVREEDIIKAVPGGAWEGWGIRRILVFTGIGLLIAGIGYAFFRRRVVAA